jgi:hypothetical protein
MSPKCPQCGYEPPKGRPKKLDDEAIWRWHKGDHSLAVIARAFKVTRGAVQASIKRYEKTRKRK